MASDQAAIDNAATQLGYATIRAPIDGVTGFRQVDIGNIVNASGQSAIVTITQVEPIFVVFTAPEDQLPAITAALRKGDVPVEAWSSDGLTKLADGKLALFNNQVDTATGTIRLKAVYENRNHALWPGLSVSTKMRVGTVATATTVPDDADPARASTACSPSWWMRTNRAPSARAEGGPLGFRPDPDPERRSDSPASGSSSPASTRSRTAASWPTRTPRTRRRRSESGKG